MWEFLSSDRNGARTIFAPALEACVPAVSVPGGALEWENEMSNDRVVRSARLPPVSIYRYPKINRSHDQPSEA